MESIKRYEIQLTNLRHEYEKENKRIRDIAYTDFKLHMLTDKNKSIFQDLLSKAHDAADSINYWVSIDTSVFIDTRCYLEIELLREYLKEKYSLQLDMTNPPAVRLIGYY